MDRACAGARPATVSSSSAASRAAESDQRSSMIGKSFCRSSPSRAERRSGSRAFIQERLPRTVLISPLWASRLNGWARSHVPRVLVENREWTRAMALSTSGSSRSG